MNILIWVCEWLEQTFFTECLYSMMMSHSMQVFHFNHPHYVCFKFWLLTAHSILSAWFCKVSKKHASSLTAKACCRKMPSWDGGSGGAILLYYTMTIHPTNCPLLIRRSLLIRSTQGTAPCGGYKCIPSRYRHWATYINDDISIDG